MTKKIEIIDLNRSIGMVKNFLLEVQNEITHFVTLEEQKEHFYEEEWQHIDEGGGITRVLEQGELIEKAGVNFSHVGGKELPIAATSKRPELKESAFQAMGVSAVIHPHNPFIPTTHFNIRFIIVDMPKRAPFWWFGGGFDLTPYFAFEEDSNHWHHEAKAVCQERYVKFKQWADQYFFLKHRNEPRGIGGLFFDDVNEGSFAESFQLIKRVAKQFIKAYQPILQRRKTHRFQQIEKEFQLYRRGRYVEFNLLYDRGTLFGLQSKGRVESILMSLPPLVAWQYQKKPQFAEYEKRLLDHFLLIKNQ